MVTELDLPSILEARIAQEPEFIQSVTFAHNQIKRAFKLQENFVQEECMELLHRIGPTPPSNGV